jgi:hypothetical protein
MVKTESNNFLMMTKWCPSLTDDTSVCAPVQEQNVGIKSIHKNLQHNNWLYNQY